MGPKKAAVAIADPPSPTEEDSPEEETEHKPVDAAAVRKLTTHPATAIMVREALKELDSRKGVSSQAIQKYIHQKYPSVDVVRLKSLVRKALKKGIENGTLVRPANATVTTGATGKFRLAPLAPKSKESKAKGENADPNVQKAPKAAKNGAKGEAKKKNKTADAKKKGAKEGSKQEKSSEEPKPAKKPKESAEEDDEGSTSKVAPAKKPKAKKSAETEEGDDSEAVKPKGKSKAAKEEKEKTGKKKQNKSPAKSDDAPAKGKRGRKAAE